MSSELLTSEGARTVPSSSQIRLWFLAQLNPANRVHNLVAAVRLRGDVELEALDQALAGVIARHPSLRTRFPTVDGRAVAEVEFGAGRGARARGGGHRRLGGGDFDVVCWAREQAHVPFNLGTGAMFRGALTRCSQTEHVLVLNTHRIVCDKRSLRIVQTELRSLVGAGGADALEPALEYARVARRHQDALRGDAVEGSSSTTRSGGLTATPDCSTFRPIVGGLRSRATATPGRSSAGRRGWLSAWSVIAVTTVSCRSWWRSQRWPPSCTGARAHATSRSGSRSTGGRVPGARQQSGRWRTQPSCAAACRRRRASERWCRAWTTLLEKDLAHAALPFESLVDAVDPQRSLSHAPLFQLLVEPFERGADRGRPGELIAVGTGACRFDLVLRVPEQELSETFEFDYGTDLFDRERIVRLGGHVLTVLESGTDAPETAIGSLPLLTEEERRQTLVVLNQTSAYYPDRCTRELFEERVGDGPDAIAVCCAGDALGCRDLDGKSNQLHTGCAGRECTGKRWSGCAWSLPSRAFGIFKAGRAYVPLDPGYPSDRLRFMGRVVMFPSRLSTARTGDEPIGWRGPVSPGTEAHPLDDDHTCSLRRPQVDDFTAQSVPILCQAQESRGRA